MNLRFQCIEHVFISGLLLGAQKRGENKLSCECNKVITDILGKIEFYVDLENTGKNTQFKT